MKKRIISLTVVLILCFSMFNFTSLKAQNIEDTNQAQEITGEGFQEALKNDEYTLFYNPSTAEIAIKNNATDLMRYSNPQDREKDNLANAQIKNNLSSQVVVYYNKDDVLETMDSYKFGTALKQVNAKKIGDTLSVNYNIGEQSFTSAQLPKVISKNRLEKNIFSKITAEEKEEILSVYSLISRDELDEESIKAISLAFPSIEKYDIYVRDEIQDYLGEPIWEIFEKAGYTLKDLQKDCDENGIENTYKVAPFFEVTLDYKLTANGFTVALDPSSFKYTQEYKPLRIEILPYFGAAGVESNGYILVPDGSGAIIDFNNKRLNSNEYWQTCFGHDYVISKTEEEPQNEKIVLPVFALSDENGGILACVDKGYEASGIVADISEKNCMYNRASFFFDVCLSDTISLGENSANNIFVETAEELFSGKIQISYHLTDGYTQYYEFAKIYRDYLIKNNRLPQNEKQSSSNLNIDFIGAVAVKKNFLGFSYETLEAATSLEQANEIVEKLGTENLDVKMTNSLSGGLYQKDALKLKIDRCVGNKGDLKALDKNVNEVYFSYFSLQQKSASKSKVARMVDGSLCKRYTYDKVSRLAENKGVMLQLTPSIFESGVKKLLSYTKKSGINALNVQDAWELNSDLNSKNYLDSYKARKKIENYLSEVSKERKLSVEKGSIFSIPYADKIWNVPIDSSGYTIFNRSVPFYALVLRGSVPIVTKPINTSHNWKNQLLKTVEVGGEIQFSWIYDLPDNVCNSSEKYYDRDYKTTLEVAKEYAERMGDLNSAIGNSCIESHESISEDLIKTVYENGAKVYVNFSNSDLVVDNITVPARDFVVERG